MKIRKNKNSVTIKLSIFSIPQLRKAIDALYEHREVEFGTYGNKKHKIIFKLD